MTVENRRPLPGVAFKVEAPPRVSLPRMDVTAFVGFAEKGPLHLPVVIEDLAHFTMIFGGAVQLAFDPAVGRWQGTCLARAVADFFAQGGKRCWVVRVAGDGAVTNRFPLIGMLHGSGGDFTPATAHARSAGSWSDTLRTGVSLLIQPLAYEIDEIVGSNTYTGAFQVLRGVPLRAGDVIQLDCEGDFRAYVAVRTVSDTAPPVGKTGRWQRVSGEQILFSRRSRDLNGKLRAFDGETVRLTVDAKLLQPDLSYFLEIEADPLPQFIAGEWLKFTSNTGVDVWMMVESSGADGVVIRTGWRVVTSRRTPLQVTRASRVSVALDAREGDELRGRLSDLALMPEHPRYWGALPDDETLFFKQNRARVPTDTPTESPLYAEAAAPRYPFAAPRGLPADSVYLPLAVEGAPVFYGAPLKTNGLALQRDGLVPPTADPITLTPAQWATFFEAIFLDSRLAWTAQDALMGEAFDILYLTEYSSDNERMNQRLRGLHAVLPLDEVSVLALPDAAQRGWRVVEEFVITPEPEPEPDPPAPECVHELFQPEPVEVEPEIPPPPPPPPLILTPPEALTARWTLLDAAEMQSAALMRIHQRAVELCAARADAVAVLSLPQHYRARDTLEYTGALRDTLAQSGTRTNSYAALYHPWLMVRTARGDVETATPDGAVCGVIAAHSLNRGAWIAPANQILRSAVGVAPLLEAPRTLELYHARVNLIVREARGFSLLSASTLAADIDLEPLNVRRLLILLRRLVLRDGQHYVFAPHSPAFRTQVARQLERQLEALFMRGAFAGRDPSQSYQVVIDESVNTRQSIEAGQLIVELRVAPSVPLTFILVRLIQTEAGTLVVQEL